MLIVHQLPTKGVQVPLQREPTMPTVQTLVRDVDLFLCLGPWSDLAKANLTDSDTLLLWNSNLMHHQYRLSVLQWNPGPARRTSTNIIAATCGRFHAVILQNSQ